MPEPSIDPPKWLAALVAIYTAIAAIATGITAALTKNRRKRSNLETMAWATKESVDQLAQDFKDHKDEQNRRDERTQDELLQLRKDSVAAMNTVGQRIDLLFTELRKR